jgi:ferredoxin
MKPSKRRFSILPSTRAFFHEGRRTPGYTLFDWLHGYVYGRWPYLYIGIGTGEHPLYKKLAPLWNWIARTFFSAAGDELTHGKVTFADTYHGKVLPLGAARQLIMVEEEIRLPDLEKIIPYARARALILQSPDHIAVLDCPCRSSRQNPCLPLDVCLVVGEPFADFVIEHHPQRARWINRGEALDILQAEDERGHVHHAFFKDAMLGRFYAICNCCACCCGAMQAQRNGTPMLASSGYVSHVEPELCIACGTCVEHCQFEALSLEGEVVSVDQAACMGCGVCVSHCDQGALALVREASKGEPLEIAALLSIG